VKPQKILKFFTLKQMEEGSGYNNFFYRNSALIMVQFDQHLKVLLRVLTDEKNVNKILQDTEAVKSHTKSFPSFESHTPKRQQKGVTLLLQFWYVFKGHISI
jgi:hypothetical protein